MSINPNFNQENDSTGVQTDIRMLANGTGITAAGTITGRLIHVLTDIWLARLLGPGGFGIYAIAWNLHRMLGPFVALGAPNGIVFFGSKYWQKDPAHLHNIFRAGLLAVLPLSCLIALAAWLAADWLAVSVFDSIEVAHAIRAVGLAMPPMMVLFLASALTRVTRRMQFSVISNELVTTLSMLAAFAIIYWMTGQFWAVLAAMVISYALAACAALFFAFRLFPELPRGSMPPWLPAVRELFGFSIPTMLAGVVGVTNLWFNRLLVGVFFPAAQVGLYQAASQFNNLSGILLGSITSAFFPLIATLYQSGQHDKLNEFYKVTTKWSLYINLPVIIVVLVMPVDVMNFIYGPEYIRGADLLFILSLAQLVNVSTGSTGALFIMTGRQRQWLTLTIIAFLVSIVPAVVLIPILGVKAMAIGIVINSLCINLVGTFWLIRVAKLMPYDARYFKGLLAALAALVALLLTGRLLASSMPMFILRSALSLVAFIITLWKLGLDFEDREFLGVLVDRTIVFWKRDKRLAKRTDIWKNL